MNYYDIFNKWLPCMERSIPGSLFRLVGMLSIPVSLVEPVSHEQRDITVLARGSRSEQDLLVFVC